MSALLDKLRKRNREKKLDLLIKKYNRKQIKEDKVEDDVRNSRRYDIKKIEENKTRLNDLITKTNIERKRAIENVKKEEPKKNPHNILNNTYDSLKSGFLDTPKNKRHKFIKRNRKNFKELSSLEQKKLFNIYAKYI